MLYFLIWLVLFVLLLTLFRINPREDDVYYEPFNVRLLSVQERLAIKLEKAKQYLADRKKRREV